MVDAMHKAWFSSVCLTLSRIYYPLAGIAPWQKASENAFKHEDLDQDFYNDNKTHLNLSIVILIAAQVLLNILIVKWRWLASYIIYLEILINIAHAFVPYQYGDFKNLFLVMKSIFVYWNGACNTKFHYFATMLMLCLIYFVCLPLTYKSEDFSSREQIIIRF